MNSETMLTKKAGPNRINFTPFALKRVPVPEPSQHADGKTIVTQRDYWDSTVPGFGLRVSSTGTKTWVMFSRIAEDGRQVLKRYSLGRYTERDGDGGLTLADARRKAGQYKDAIARNENPEQAKESAQQEAIRRSAHTFGKVAEEFLRVHHPVNRTALRPSSLRRYKLVLMGPYLASWRDRPIATITRTDVLTVLHTMQAQGLGVSCNRALAAIRVLMHWCIQREIIEVAPTDHLKHVAAEVIRDRHLYGDAEHNQPSEIALLWKACAEMGPFGNFVKLLLLTGQRRDEVIGMQRRELIDLDGKNPRWSLSHERTKSGRRHLVPLSPAAVKLIQAMPQIANSEFVFSTTGTTAFSGFSNFKEKLDRKVEALKKAAPAKYARQFAEEWRMHDLRRTAKTAWADLGIASDIRDALLNHTKPGMDKVYDHSQRAAEKRAALVKWERHVMGLVQADDAQSVKRK